MDVELRHLRWFLVLAGELHYGRAAARVHISQPTLSKAIQRLEAAVGVDLFERDHRGVALTPAGAAFAVSAELSVRAADDAVTAARSAVPGPSVRIGYGVAFDVLTRVLQRVAEGDPGLRVEPVSYLYRDLSAGLGSGEADIAFTMPYLDLPGIDFLPLGAEERVLLVPEGHPAAAAPVSLDTLRALLDAETWLLPSSDPPVGSTGYRRFWAGLDQLGGPEPPVTVTFGSNEELAQLLAAGRGVALGFASLVPRYTLPGIAAAPIPELSPGLIGLAYRRPASPPVRRFIALARGLRADVAPVGRVIGGTTVIR